MNLLLSNIILASKLDPNRSIMAVKPTHSIYSSISSMQTQKRNNSLEHYDKYRN